ncbi:MAG TPA: O-acetyl-ADP-ribose deacetylase [Pyrinomonadaceae bacterium]|nr:O-acetyl-ADP-ribose deacetylase [Pyrinomonadaceae bacterium]
MSGLVKNFLQGRVAILVADITGQKVDAIVNAANSSLMGGGGVDGAIHRAGGPAILQQCREIRRTIYPQGLPTGDAVITTAGNLPARHVIHTVGPIYGEERGRDAELLAACYENSLALAAKHSLASLAFPAISTGVFGYPRAEAASVSSATVKKFLANESRLAEIRFVFFSDDDSRVFLEHQQFE